MHRYAQELGVQKAQGAAAYERVQCALKVSQGNRICMPCRRPFAGDPVHITACTARPAQLPSAPA